MSNFLPNVILKDVISPGFEGSYYEAFLAQGADVSPARDDIFTIGESNVKLEGKFKITKSVFDPTTGHFHVTFLPV